MIVVPAPLETVVEPFVANVKRLSRYYSRFQVDIADGKFVPNTTIQISDFVSIYPKLPQNLCYDFHLMVQDPLLHIDTLLSLPKSTIGEILIHLSVFPNYIQLVADYPQFRFGLVLNPEDRVESVDRSLLKSIPCVQIMTVIPGFQGQSFIPKMLQKIEQLRNRGFSGEILIDGSVNEHTLPTILELQHQPDTVGIGSYLTKTKDEELPRRVEFLKSQLIPGNKSDKK